MTEDKLLDLSFVSLPTPPPAGDESLPAKFQRNTELALDKAAEILRIDLNPESVNYGADLRAATAASAAQISAQLKADETAIRAARNNDIKELLARIAAAEIEAAALGD